jgi:hypothetical protein
VRFITGELSQTKSRGREEGYPADLSLLIAEFLGLYQVYFGNETAQLRLFATTCWSPTGLLDQGAMMKDWQRSTNRRAYQQALDGETVAQIEEGRGVNASQPIEL